MNDYCGVYGAYSGTSTLPWGRQVMTDPVNDKPVERALVAESAGEPGEIEEFPILTLLAARETLICAMFFSRSRVPICMVSQ